jgi:hypothetical protein
VYDKSLNLPSTNLGKKEIFVEATDLHGTSPQFVVNGYTKHVIFFFKKVY